jgi:hypothetical protein
MEKASRLDRLFTGTPMGWPVVIGFAVVAGVATAALNLVPALADTSATDIAVSYEWWLVFGVVIATNCESPLEAALKVFVFFLVSQPLVYLVETPFLGAHVWGYYPYWLGATVACLPAGALANQMRRRGTVGMVALALALAMLAVLAGYYGWKTWYAFPRHLVTVLFTVAAMLALAVEFSRPGKARLAMLALAVALLVASAAYQVWGVPESSTAVPLPEGTWSAVLDGPGSAEVDGSQLVYNTSVLGTGTVTCTDASGRTIVFDVGMDGSRVPYVRQRG